MDYNTFRAKFSDVWPILSKAAPILAGYVGSPLTGAILGLLGAVFKTDPCDHCALAENMKNHPDLYTKLSKLDETHKEWFRENV